MHQTAKITALYRYPLKGFSGETLTSADLQPGGALPFDRAFAIENGPSGFDPAAPSYLPKTRFLMLMRNERIAELSSRFDLQTGVLTILKAGRNQVSASLFEEAGRRQVEAWIAQEFAGELRGPPRILSAGSHSFSDKKAKVLHLINLASVRELEVRLGCKVDPVRFRANIVVDNIPAFSELDWIGKSLELPDIRLKSTDRTQRCAAIDVDPQTGVRDMQLPRQLASLLGHMDFGIYLKVESGGRIATGDTLSLIDRGNPQLPF